MYILLMMLANFLDSVSGSASLALTLGISTTTQIPNCTSCLQTLTKENDHCACPTLHLNVWH